MNDEAKPESPNAFPNTDDYGNREQGMTLRDYFAAKFGPEIRREIVAGQLDTSLRDGLEAAVSALSYEQADAMLRARAK